MFINRFTDGFLETPFYFECFSLLEASLKLNMSLNVTMEYLDALELCSYICKIDCHLLNSHNFNPSVLCYGIYDECGDLGFDMIDPT